MTILLRIDSFIHSGVQRLSDFLHDWVGIDRRMLMKITAAVYIAGGIWGCITHRIGYLMFLLYTATGSMMYFDKPRTNSNEALAEGIPLFIDSFRLVLRLVCLLWSVFVTFLPPIISFATTCMWAYTISLYLIRGSDNDRPRGGKLAKLFDGFRTREVAIASPS